MDLPTFLFDGNCGFCKYWVSRWKKHTVDRVIYRPFQEASKDFPNIKTEEYLKSSQFINLNGDVFSGAYGVAMLLSHSKKHKWFLFLYKYLPLFGFVSEFVYKQISSCRNCAEKFTNILRKKNK